MQRSPTRESLMLALRPTPQATKIGSVGRLHHFCGALLSKQATTDTTLHPSTPCALVAHLDASLRWHDGAYTAAPPHGSGAEPYFRSKPRQTHPSTPLPRVRWSRTWMPAFAGMTERTRLHHLCGALFRSNDGGGGAPTFEASHDRHNPPPLCPVCAGRAPGCQPSLA